MSKLLNFASTFLFQNDSSSVFYVAKDRGLSFLCTFPLKRILLDSLHCCSIPPKFGCLGDYNTRLLAP